MTWHLPFSPTPLTFDSSRSYTGYRRAQKGVCTFAEHDRFPQKKKAKKEEVDDRYKVGSRRRHAGGESENGLEQA